VNELRLGFNRNNQSEPVGNQTFPGLDAFPNLVFNDLNCRWPQRQLPQSGSATCTRHRQRDLDARRAHHQGGYEFGTTSRPRTSRSVFAAITSTTALANYLLDLVRIPWRNAAWRPVFYGNDLAHYMFLQDTWRISRNFTLDAGLRYEWTGVRWGQAAIPECGGQRSGLVDFRAPNSSMTGGLLLAWVLRIRRTRTATRSSGRIQPRHGRHL